MYPKKQKNNIGKCITFKILHYVLHTEFCKQWNSG